MKVESSIIQNKFLRVQTLNYGASLYEVFHNHKKINLILNLGPIQNYKFKNFSVGATCGRYAGRISNSKFIIGNKKFSLSKNDGNHTLHGGRKGFSLLPWTRIEQTKDKIIYQIKSKDLDQGFPGNLSVNCTYQLKNKYLIIKYDYQSDKYTHVNLTNHSYWNLSKNKKNKIFNHDLKLNSNKFLEVNKSLIPTGKIKNIDNGIFNFLKFENLNKKFDLLIKSKKKRKFLGFDTTYIIKKNKKNFIGSLRNQSSGVKIDFFSNLPAVQFYTAQSLKYKSKLKPYDGLCIETQYFPDTPNNKNFPSTLIKPNKYYSCFTKIKIN